MSKFQVGDKVIVLSLRHYGTHRRFVGKLATVQDIRKNRYYVQFDPYNGQELEETQIEYPEICRSPLFKALREK